MIRLWRKEHPCHPHHDAAQNGGPVRLEGANKEILEAGRSRLVLCAGLFTIAFAALSVRLVDVTVFNQPREPQLDRADRAINLPLERADIVDRNGVLLATSLATASLYADPKEIRDAASAARQLVGVLPDLKQSEVLDKLRSGRRFVWIQRNLTPRQEYEVNRLGIPGLYFQREDRRVYPHGVLTAHVVGFTNVDNHGMAGIERHFDATLSKGGAPLVLSLDLRVQHVVREELLAGMQEFRAIGAGAAVLDARTGEVLSLVSLPDFDANKAGEASDDARFNRMTLGVYEMGSIFKVFTAAMALETGASKLTSSYDATHPIHVARFTISDYHAKRRVLTVPEIFMYSSNIGAAKMALDVGGAMQHQFLARFGLLSPSKLEINELGIPEFPAQWRPINTMTIAFGHGVSVEPIQVAAATTAIVDGGILHDPTLLKRRAGEDAAGVRILSERTSDEMRRLMRLVVTGGTAKEGITPGYLVGGKTGTAEKASKRGYLHHELLSSFVGAFPITAPKYVVLAFYDEPHGNAKTHGYATAGWTAVPVVNRIVHRIAPLLGVTPVDEKDPEIERALMIDGAPTPQDRKIASN
jgi:cell division protein FtsI (penicillin-binding protein 3)